MLGGVARRESAAGGTEVIDRCLLLISAGAMRKWGVQRARVGVLEGRSRPYPSGTSIQSLTGVLGVELDYG